MESSTSDLDLLDDKDSDMSGLATFCKSSSAAGTCNFSEDVVSLSESGLSLTLSSSFCCLSILLATGILYVLAVKLTLCWLVLAVFSLFGFDWLWETQL